VRTTERRHTAAPAAGIAAQRAARAAAWRAAIRPGSWTLYTLGLAPAAWTFLLAVSDQLGADPLKALERSLGLWALRFLVLSLALSPLRQLGGPNLVRYRRMVGLLAFFYALFHVTVYVCLDQQLDPGAIWKDIVKRPYITIGLASFLILVPLAATSNGPAIKRLGGATWQRLHRWVYLAAAGAALHFIMLVKAWPVEPFVYAAIVAGLLLIRIAFRIPAATGKKARRTPMTKTQDAHDDAYWRAKLTPEQYRVLREGGTEQPFTGAHLDTHAEGHFTCAACGTQLFASDTKFESGTGWPSFDQALPGAITSLKDISHGMVRTEVRCATCGSHLGHVFDDGPTGTGKRYCINSVCLNHEATDPKGSE